MQSLRFKGQGLGHFEYLNKAEIWVLWSRIMDSNETLMKIVHSNEL